MVELFKQYVPIHCKGYGINPEDLLLQITGDGFVLISHDFFSFSGEYDDVLRALRSAVSNDLVLINQGG